MNKNRKIIVGFVAILLVIIGMWKFGQSHNKTIFLSSQPQSADSLEAYYQKSQELSQQQNQKSQVTFLAVGDIMLSRNVAEKIKQSSDILLPFRGMADLLKAMDFNFANLESPFYFNRKNENDITSGIIGGHSLEFGAPQSNVQGLAEYNFKMLNLANNHAMDQSQAGLESTKQLLKNNGIQSFGAGNNLDKAWQPTVIEQNGIKICFLGASYASYNDGSKTVNMYVARIEDMVRLKTSVEAAKTLCNFTVVSMHAGTEYTRNPNLSQINFAHAAIDAGADLVIGAHPHWIQTIEKYNGSPADPACKKSSFDNPVINQNGTKYQSLNLGSGCAGKYIFYSLGNFIFDQEWSQETKEGLALKIQISKNQTGNSLAPGAAGIDVLQGNKITTKLESIQLLPVIIENSSAPRLANPDETKRTLEKIGQKENALE